LVIYDHSSNSTIQEYGEQTFYIQGHHIETPLEPTTFVVRALTADNARVALSTKGFVSTIVTRVTPPVEPGFKNRPDGTVLVSAFRSQHPLQVYGPFNDEADAKRWMGAKDYDGLNRDPVVYTVIEPHHCFRVTISNGSAAILDFPPGFFDKPL